MKLHKKCYDIYVKILKGRIIMNITQATAERFIELCAEKGITVNKLATISGVTQSTVSDIVNMKSKNIGIVTIKKLCDGLDISISDFFDTDRFRTLQQEMY